MLRLKLIPQIILAQLILIPSISSASFIETTMGTAVVNDATAAYYNPAALMLLKNSQLIPLGTVARFRTQFNGQSITLATRFKESGTSNSVSDYYAGSLYFGIPLNNKMTLGFAAVSNFANRNPEENAILRYVQASNTIQDYDLVPSLGLRINKWLALGMGINFSSTHFNLRPIIGFPGSNIIDSQSNNQSSGSGIGGNIGFLLQPSKATLMGLNYRTLTTYNENGRSVLNGEQPIISNHYHFKLRTPARIVLSISHLLTEQIGFITTVQRIQWGITKNINVNGVATRLGNIPIVVNASIPYHLQDTWAFTIGGHYRFNPCWIIRIASTYNQSPNNGRYQISTGDNYVLGASVGYAINNKITLDGGYAHAFIHTEKINIRGNRYLIMGDNQASRDVISLKIIWNI